MLFRSDTEAVQTAAVCNDCKTKTAQIAVQRAQEIKGKCTA